MLPVFKVERTADVTQMIRKVPKDQWRFLDVIVNTTTFWDLPGKRGTLLLCTDNHECPPPVGFSTDSRASFRSSLPDSTAVQRAPSHYHGTS